MGVIICQNLTVSIIFRTCTVWCCKSKQQSLFSVGNLANDEASPGTWQPPKPCFKQGRDDPAATMLYYASWLLSTKALVDFFRSPLLPPLQNRPRLGPGARARRAPARWRRQDAQTRSHASHTPRISQPTSDRHRGLDAGPGNASQSASSASIGSPPTAPPRHGPVPHQRRQRGQISRIKEFRIHTVRLGLTATEVFA